MAHRWMSLRAVLAYEPEMQRLGVSEVARSPRGFLTAYKRYGTAAATKNKPAPRQVRHLTWGQRREQFVARTLAQYRVNPTHRRRLALIAWAYDPDAAQHP